MTEPTELDAARERLEQPDRTLKWLRSAAKYFHMEMGVAETRWQAEQHQERWLACEAAIKALHTGGGDE